MCVRVCVCVCVCTCLCVCPHHHMCLLIYDWKQCLCPCVSVCWHVAISCWLYYSSWVFFLVFNFSFRKVKTIFFLAFYSFYLNSLRAILLYQCDRVYRSSYVVYTKLANFTNINGFEILFYSSDI